MFEHSLKYRLEKLTDALVAHMMKQGQFGLVEFVSATVTAHLANLRDQRGVFKGEMERSRSFVFREWIVFAKHV